MDVLKTSLNNIPLLEARGEIDHGNCAELESALHDTIGAGNRVVMVDLSDVNYIDSGGLSVLFWALKQLRHSGWLGIVGPNANVRRLLELVGILADPGLRLFDDRQTAEAALDDRTGVA